jgi:LmbE family N-acetylglucosaminyl deacetylase
VRPVTWQPVASIVIPTWNHADFLRDAIASALAQTVPCEIIVVDDGSTDDTAELLSSYADIWCIRLPHRGPSHARNAGLEAARTEFVMFLDADDVIAPGKVELQLKEFAEHPDAGFVLCDIQIEDEARGRSRRASEQYGYAQKELGGWIHRELLAGNFIPIMSPLIRRSAIPDWLRFEDEELEDWQFWCKLSMLVRARYVPEVLATYRHRKIGRSRIPKANGPVYPTLQAPLRLNLGCGTPNTRSWHPMPGFVNLDKSMGWCFEDGLKAFANSTVYGITISHALMYLAEPDWPRFFAEVSRVLVEGGIVRITEDETEHPDSSRRGGWHGSQPAVTLTSPGFVSAHLVRAGLEAVDITADTSRFRDNSLCQAQHGEAPDVFFIEGIKPRTVVFAPHNDDETLFASGAILRYHGRVVVCFGSAGDYGDSAVREQETRAAMELLGAGAVEQWASSSVADLIVKMRDFDARVHPERVWAPSSATSHPDHEAVAKAAVIVFGARVTQYETYIDGERVTMGERVPFEPEWIALKLAALSKYTTQILHPRAGRFFLQAQIEYEVPK